MDISVLLTAANGQSVLLDVVPSFAGGTWNTISTPYLCASRGGYSISGISWPADITLDDGAGIIVAEFYAFDPGASANSGNAALRCGKDAMFPQDPGPLGTPGSYTWKVQ
jgi:hypothetical protein